MNISATDLLNNLAGSIRNVWASDKRATVTVAADPAHAVELLTAGSANGCAVVIFYLSDLPDADEFDQDTRVAAQIRVAVVQNPGLTLRDGRKAPAVLRLIDDFRKWFAAQTIEGTLDTTLKYKGMTHIPAAAGNALHGYAMTYEAVYAYETED